MLKHMKYCSLILILLFCSCDQINNLLTDSNNSNTLQQTNPIWFSDFEDPLVPLLNWWDQQENVAEYCNTEKVNGNYSLKLEAKQPTQMQTVSQIAYLVNRSAESSITLIPGKKYKLSANIKTQGNISNSPDPASNPNWHSGYIIFYVGNQWNQIGVGEDSDWQLVEEEFIVPSDYNGQLEVYISTISDFAYFDDIKLEVIN